MQDVSGKLFRDEFQTGSAQKIENVLERLRERREYISVLPHDRAEEFSSMVLAIDPGRHWLLIDELNPDIGNRRVVGGAPFFVVARLDGIFVGFQSRLLEAVEWEGFGALRIAYPTNGYYMQRRGYFRVSVAPGDIGTVELQRRGARALLGQCHDISVRGMRLLLNAPTDYALHEGEFVPLVRFNLDGHELAAEGEIRFVGHVRGGPRTRQESRQVGVEFLNVSPGFEQRVQQYVQRRDRELLRDSRG